MVSLCEVDKEGKGASEDALEASQSNRNNDIPAKAAAASFSLRCLWSLSCFSRCLDDTLEPLGTGALPFSVTSDFFGANAGGRNRISAIRDSLSGSKAGPSQDPLLKNSNHLAVKVSLLPRLASEFQMTSFRFDWIHHNQL